jgi:hypothetical protein
MDDLISQSVWSIFKATPRHPALGITVQDASNALVLASNPITQPSVTNESEPAWNSASSQESQLPPFTFPEYFRLPDLLSIINPVFHYGVSKHRVAAMEAAGQWYRRHGVRLNACGFS